MLTYYSALVSSEFSNTIDRGRLKVDWHIYPVRPKWAQYLQGNTGAVAALLEKNKVDNSSRTWMGCSFKSKRSQRQDGNSFS